MLDGLNMMSKTAVIVQKSFIQLPAAWQKKMQEDLKKLHGELDVYRKEYERIRDNLKPGECAKHDAAQTNTCRL